MFRQKLYNNVEDNSLLNRLNYLDNHDVDYERIKFWDINHNVWIDNDNLIDYKIQKEIVVDNELIFYIYSEDYNAKDWE